MQEVEDSILDFPQENQRKIAFTLHKFLCSFPGIEPKIRYKIPFYFRKSWVCYLNPLKKDGAVELAFTRGNELSNNQGILESKNRKQILGITLNAIDQIPFDSINEIMMEAILLDDQVPYSVKKNS